MRDIVDPLNELNATMVAISPQNQEKNKELGLVFEVAPEIKEIYGGFGIDLPTSNGEDSWTLPMPTRLVVSQDGIVRATDIDPNHTARPEPQKTVDDVKAL